MTDSAARAARQEQGAFFGRRKGHKLRAHQSNLIATMLPQLAIDIAQPAPSSLNTLFPTTAEAVHLEIGCGGGEHLIAAAVASPQIGFIGCEPYVNGMAKILAQIERAGLRNIRLFAGDAIALLRWMPPHSLSRIELIHPDPWPKRRHWKRRFVQSQTLGELARVLTSAGEFRFASDIDDYCGWTLAHVMRGGHFSWLAERADDWQMPWPEFAMTRYGRKAEREGRKASYLRFKATV